MNDSNPETPLRQCSKGDNCAHPDGCWQQDDAEHFYQGKGGKQCIACHRARCLRNHYNNRDNRLAKSREWRKANPERAKQGLRRWREENIERVQQYEQHYREENREIINEKLRRKRRENREPLLKRRRELYAINRARIRERVCKWRKINRSHVNAARRVWYRKNRESERIRQRRWRTLNHDKIVVCRRVDYQNNREKRIASSQRWAKSNRLRVRMRVHNRRAIARALPATLTTTQWQSCLEYFHNCCAYCGAQQSLWHTIEQEHVVSVKEGGAYTALNVVPACKSCNSSKSDTPLADWLRWKYPRKAKTILARIETYFAWVREQDSE